MSACYHCLARHGFRVKDCFPLASSLTGSLM
jgi:hypothetical protein